MTDEVLKPCPICWEQVKLQIYARFYSTDALLFSKAPDGYLIKCQNDQHVIGFYGHTKEETIAKWNAIHDVKEVK